MCYYISTIIICVLKWGTAGSKLFVLYVPHKALPHYKRVKEVYIMYDFFSFCTLIRNEKFKSLSKTARLLYIYMLTDSYISGSGEDGFEFPQEVQKEYNLTKGGGQFYTDRQELIDAGFLDIVFNGKRSRQPNIYAISTRWKNQTVWQER